MPGKLYCNAACKFNDNPDGLCTISQAFIVARRCITFHKRPREEDYANLMKQSEPVGYRRGNKWVKTK